MFKFIIKNTDGSARKAVLNTPHGKINTPVFMPVGTKGTVKTLSQKDLENLNAEIILANTYHLYLRPGEKVIKKMGKLHKWINWKKPMLTDSGGFQVFSLAQNKNFTKNKIKDLVKIDDNGVEFKSYLDGSKHYLTPEKAIQIQHDLGADIIMAFDECAPGNSTKKYFKKAMERTHDWLIRCKKEHEKLLKKSKEKRALFGIVQGGSYKDLRKESAKFVNDLDFIGNAIGGLAVGEKKEKMLKMLDATIPHLNENKPRYLMGVGTPEDILEAVERGVDMFDCVHATRIARHGAFWTKQGRKVIKNTEFTTDPSPLEKNCKCESCQNYSRSYIRHLIRESIKKKEFKKFKKTFLKKFKSKK